MGCFGGHFAERGLEAMLGQTTLPEIGSTITARSE
jgi:hypothetical protein